MDWLEVSLEVSREAVTGTEACFEAIGALAITLRDAADDPLFEPPPGATPLWPSARITALFEATESAGRIAEAVAAMLGAATAQSLRFAPLAEREWTREWLAHFRPMRFGRRLWVLPHAAERPDDPDAVCVRLDPGLAFGTGTHETTALCLAWLDGAIDGGERLLDFGCGSGILSTATLKLGAAAAMAVDIDPQALEATRLNAAANGCAARVTASDVLPAARYDVIVANVLAGPLVEHAAALIERLAAGGRIALSGVLAEQADAVMTAYAHAIRFDPPAERGGWVRLAGRCG